MGKTKHTNRLFNETSPYLLQHAHNPVDWYPWGEEALQKAKTEDKVILVSIGYSACHWCHVMEKESFEDVETAILMNENFINIKIDREERPDLDHVYMEAVQLINGNGGWPLNVFLTPDEKPFFGGTYYPPVRMYNQPAWKDILRAVKDAYTKNRDEIEQQAENLMNHIGGNSISNLISKTSEDDFFKTERLNEIGGNILKNADTVWGGFGKAPKFPQTFCIRYLMSRFYYTNEQPLLDQALLSLTKMLQGGIFDQLEGGFSRYSTDDKWLVPHFEKMLYDNALLIEALSEAFQITGNPVFSDTITQTLHFIGQSFTNEDGGFYSAFDADSEGEEGKYYTWSKEEVDHILQEDAELFSKIFDLSASGNWEGRNILWLPVSLEEWSQTLSLPLPVLKEKISVMKQKLIAAKQGRVKPGLDDKILPGWNALMVKACCKAYAATGNSQALTMATANLSFLEKNLWIADQLYHSYTKGRKKQTAFLDDYASLIAAYIAIQEVSGENKWLEKAKRLTEKVIHDFSDAESSYFYFTPSHQNDIVVRKTELYDGATPSGNSMMAGNLLKLSVLLERTDWKERAIFMVKNLSDAIRQYPTSFGEWALVWQEIVKGTNEIAIVGKGANDLLPKLLRFYIPNKVLQIATAEGSDYPLLKGKKMDDGKDLIYVCYDYACQKPVASVEEIKYLLKK